METRNCTYDLSVCRLKGLFWSELGDFLFPISEFAVVESQRFFFRREVIFEVALKLVEEQKDFSTDFSQPLETEYFSLFDSRESCLHSLRDPIVITILGYPLCQLGECDSLVVEVPF